MERLKKQLKSHIHHRHRDSTASDKENNPDDYGAADTGADEDGGRLSMEDLDSEEIIPDRRRMSSSARRQHQRRSLDDSDLLL